MNKIFSALAFSLLITLTLASCGKKESGPGQYGLSTKNNVVWWIAADITNIIPPLAHDAGAQYAGPLVWEPLNGSNSRTQEMIPLLASLPEISADHLTYTYTINPKAKFSDGVPFTGEDVVFSFKCVMNPKQLETTQTRSSLNSVDSISFVGGDKMKVAFHLNEPYFQMNIVLGGGYVSMLPKHIFDPKNMTDQMSWKDIKSANPKNPVFQQEADDFKDPSKIRKTEMMIGTGAYLYKEWMTNDHISFKKNPNYWGKDVAWQEAYPDEIVFKTITDNNSAVTALKAKDIDIMDIVPAAAFVLLDPAKQPFIKKDTVYYNSRVYVEWNGERPLFKDKNVRWALSHLIDRDILVKEVMKGLARPINGPINFTQPHYDETLPPITFDPALAKKMLADNGWADSDGDGILDKVIGGKRTPFHFSFDIYSGSDVVKQTALVIAEEMRKAGIKVDVSTSEWSVWINNSRSHNYDASIANILGNASEDDPYGLWHSSQAMNKGQNVYSFINAEADKILEQNKTEFDFNKRDSLMKRFQRIVYDEMPITPLWSAPLRVARIDRFDNVEFFKQRPGFNVQYWIVRGSGVKPVPGAMSTYQPVP
ncbi:MAG: ABC transporter substrate-binding protein [Ignavibacteriota bacterium]